MTIQKWLAKINLIYTFEFVHFNLALSSNVVHVDIVENSEI